MQQRKGEKSLKVIVINGQGGIGKNTFVGYCIKAHEDTRSISLINEIKYVAKILGWKGDKTKRDRKFLNNLKQLTTKYNNFPFESVALNISNILEQYKEDEKSTKDLIIFIHAREPEDINYLVNKYDAKTLLIRKSGLAKKYGNPADDKVFDTDYDYIVYNDANLEELEAEAEKFMRKILGQDK